MDELWLLFCKTGKINDYLKYKNAQVSGNPEVIYADNDKRYHNKRTDCS